MIEGLKEHDRFPVPLITPSTKADEGHDEDISREEIIASVDRAVICETFASGQAEIGSGNFSFSVKNGWLVENGRVTAPVKDFNIHGNGADLLRNISMVADDGRMDPGGWICGKKKQNVPVSQGMPTVLVDKLTIDT